MSLSALVISPARHWLIAMAMVCVAMPSSAAESGQTYFAHGVQTVYSAFVPEPGKTQFYGYSLFYDATSLRDAQGDRIPDISAQGIAFAPRVLHTLEQSVGGFNLSVGGLFMLLHSGLETPAGEAFDNGPSMAGLEGYLSRSYGAWHFMAGFLLYIPWGHYDPAATSNVMLNRYGGAINSAVTWTPSPRWDVSLTFAHEFKGRNRDSQYRDGQQSGLTYGVAYRPFNDMRWDFGFSGFYTVQIEDDRQSGATVADQRLRKFAIGPKVSYWFKPGAGVILQWHKEYEVRNAPRGDMYWLLFTLPLSD